ncbi:MAG: 4'-phosphopantetheinyl transferase superfamily protein [Phycisphaerales bacterium]|nr:4'-phosphopantetheinyl transferase superfamily protein [Phycisphaerales bacterium]
MLHIVLIPIPDNGRDVPPRERIRRQRDAAAHALDESARLSGLPRLAWERDAAGVPVFDRGVCWSLSHKPSIAAGVVAAKPVGVDVEVVQPRNEGLWEYVASREEQDRAGTRDWPMFFRFWTAKEAVLKANRVGLSRLDDCRVIDAPYRDSALLTFAGRPLRVTYFHSGDVLAAVTAEPDGAAWHEMPAQNG